MLAELVVERIALIEQARLVFPDGLIAFTGETGAGKSILLDAIGLLLGQRASADMIRAGAASALVEALFVPSDGTRPRIAERLAAWGMEDEVDQIVVSREIHRSGRTVCRINGRMATVQMLRELGALLVQQQGQHDQHGLLRLDEQRRLLDLYARLTPDLCAMQRAYAAWREALAAWEAAQLDERARAQRLDMIQFQIEEISAANLQPGEEEALREERQRLLHAERILGWIRQAAERLQGRGGAPGAAGQLASAREEVAAAQAYDPALAEPASLLETAQVYAEEAERALFRYLDRIEADPRRLEAVEERLALIRSLERKYGATVEDVLAHLAAIQAERDRLQSHDEEIRRLGEMAASARAEVEALAERLHHARTEAAAKLAATVTDLLRQLHMPRARFEVEVRPKRGSDGGWDAGPDGADEVVFWFSANLGEDARPLHKVASGGELSRTLLALKVALAEVDDVDTLVFDEIDAGISGHAALAVAEQLRRLGARRQVLCVTHAAQIAAAAHAHFCIEKVERDHDTTTVVRPLSEEGRVREVARLIGADVSDATAWEHAGAMLRSLQTDAVPSADVQV
ncbi:DNA repair protein RecN [Alicyclobacillus cellulosilyticus]|uniref:DNA repair protein RecN n=1 Tax=Alicyclobacillus cellulosilyticus TaxID=1003997 RepID=A0A917NFH3_9BACL|nr:DNA repair protein RecN [Alicyclobacillus cellulosilyticus]GGI95822.1 DNA repair protein RecN [Alicyclobacillus cellulosilyticus]